MADLRRLGVLAAAASLVLAACGGTSPGADSPGDGAGSTAAPSPAPGEPIPDDEIEAFDGGTVSLTDHAGTPLVVNFWASWCGPCIAEMPDLEAVHQAVGDQVTFVGVNTQDSPDRAAELVDETGVTYALVRDPTGSLSQSFGVFGMPSTFYVDADGRIVGRHTGLLTRDALLEDLREHLGVELAADGWPTSVRGPPDRRRGPGDPPRTSGTWRSRPRSSGSLASNATSNPRTSTSTVTVASSSTVVDASSARDALPARSPMATGKIAVPGSAAASTKSRTPSGVATASNWYSVGRPSDAGVTRGFPSCGSHAIPSRLVASPMPLGVPSTLS